MVTGRVRRQREVGGGGLIEDLPGCGESSMRKKRFVPIDATEGSVTESFHAILPRATTWDPDFEAPHWLNWNSKRRVEVLD